MAQPHLNIEQKFNSIAIEVRTGYWERAEPLHMLNPQIVAAIEQMSISRH
jgi:hypothetical protein